MKMAFIWKAVSLFYLLSLPPLTPKQSIIKSLKKGLVLIEDVWVPIHKCKVSNSKQIRS